MIKKGVYLTLCSFDGLKSRKLSNRSQKQSNGGCPFGYVLMTAPIVPCKGYIGCMHISVWASVLFVSTTMGNARRLDRETSIYYSNPHFFVSCTKLFNYN